MVYVFMLIKPRYFTITLMRLLVFDTIFVHKITNGIIDCPVLLQKIDLQKSTLLQFKNNFPFVKFQSK